MYHQYGDDRIGIPFGFLPDTMNLYNVSPSEVKLEFDCVHAENN